MAWTTSVARYCGRPAARSPQRRKDPTALHPIRLRIAMLGLTLLAGLATPTTATAATVPAPTVEEQRLDRAAPREILQRSGFDAVTREFARSLGSARSYARARDLVAHEGAALWRRAVDRAQGRGPAGGGPPPGGEPAPFWGGAAPAPGGGARARGVGGRRPPRAAPPAGLGRAP